MANYQSYVRTYSFGMEGSAALAANPHRPTRTPPQQPRANRPGQQAANVNARPRGLAVPRWLLLVMMAILAVALLGVFGQLNERRHQLRAELIDQQAFLADAKAEIDRLDLRIAGNKSDTRIHADARNHLGMAPPADLQICRVPVPRIVSGEQSSAWAPATQEISVFGAFVSAARNLFGQGDGAQPPMQAQAMPQTGQQNPAWLKNPT